MIFACALPRPRTRRFSQHPPSERALIQARCAAAARVRRKRRLLGWLRWLRLDGLRRRLRLACFCIRCGKTLPFSARNPLPSRLRQNVNDASEQR